MIRKLQKMWPRVEVNYHRWIQFSADGARGYAEPEAFIVLRDRVLLFEAKLTARLDGKLQMEWLYKPLLEYIFERRVICLLVTKNVRKDTPGPRFESPEAFLRSGADFGTWHWLPD